ncbi:MAG: hypothetical protein WAN93_03115 [Solirubrobacteraceae bacterium]
MGAISTLPMQPAHLIQQAAVLQAKRSRLTTSRRQLLGEHWEDRAKVRQPLDELLAVAHPSGDLGTGKPAGAIR